MSENTANIILASSSVYRRELLKRLHIDFEVFSPDIDETRKPDETPSQLVQRLSKEKAQVIANKSQDAIVIGSDQVAVCGNEILGKPGNLENAIAQLKTLSGNVVMFHTGLTVIDTNSQVIQTDEVLIKVTFKTLDDLLIQRYLENEPAFNCAGTFKSEGLGISLVKSIEQDDPTALIGLPLIRLIEMLDNIGYSVI